MRSYDELYYELSVLSKAVAFSNLSAASMQVGLSQPQLSRVVKRLEDDLGVTLLERASKRKSSWTPLALRLSETFLKTSRQLSTEIENSVSASEMVHIRIGTLEGLAGTAMKLCHSLLERSKLQVIELNVYDLSDLEDQFLKGNYEVIFTSREPAHRKYQHEFLLGYQTLQEISKNPTVEVMSSFEYHSQSASKTRAKKAQKYRPYLISNSLSVRKDWLKAYGGKGLLPSEIHKISAGGAKEVPAVMLGSEVLTSKFWDLLVNLIQSLAT